MTIGPLSVELFLPYSVSLKDTRMVLRRLNGPLLPSRRSNGSSLAWLPRAGSSI